MIISKIILILLLLRTGRDTLPVYYEDTIVVSGFYTHSFVFPELSLKDIESVPGFLEPDITGYISKFPFVSQADNFIFTNAIYIRGQDPWQTVFYFDSIPVLSPFHFFGVSSFPVAGFKKVEYFPLFHPVFAFKRSGNVFNIVPIHEHRRSLFQSPLNTTVSFVNKNINFTGRIFYPALLINALSHKKFSVWEGDSYVDFVNNNFGIMLLYSFENTFNKDTISDYLMSRFKSFAAGIKWKKVRWFYSSTRKFSRIEDDTIFNDSLSLYGIEFFLRNNVNVSFSRFYQGQREFFKLVPVSYLSTSSGWLFTFAPVVYFHNQNLYINPDFESLFRLNFESFKLSMGLKERSHYLSGKSPLYTIPIIPEISLAPERMWEADFGIMKIYSKGRLSIESYAAYHENYRFYHTDRFFLPEKEDEFFSFSDNMEGSVREVDSISLWRGSKVRAGINARVSLILKDNFYLQLFGGSNVVKIITKNYSYFPSYMVPFKFSGDLFFNRNGWSAMGTFTYLSGKFYATRVINYGYYPVYTDKFYYYPLPSEFTISIGVSKRFKIGSFKTEFGFSINRIGIREGISYYLYPEYYNLPSLFFKMEW